MLGFLCNTVAQAKTPIPKELEGWQSWVQLKQEVARFKQANESMRAANEAMQAAISKLLAKDERVQCGSPRLRVTGNSNRHQLLNGVARTLRTPAGHSGANVCLPQSCLLWLELARFC